MSIPNASRPGWHLRAAAAVGSILIFTGLGVSPARVEASSPAGWTGHVTMHRVWSYDQTDEDLVIGSAIVDGVVTTSTEGVAITHDWATIGGGPNGSLVCFGTKTEKWSGTVVEPAPFVVRFDRNPDGTYPYAGTSLWGTLTDYHVEYTNHYYNPDPVADPLGGSCGTNDASFTTDATTDLRISDTEGVSGVAEHEFTGLVGSKELGGAGAQVRHLTWSLTSEDSDGDGLIDPREIALDGTAWDDPDSDNDGPSDGYEVFTYYATAPHYTDPNNPDSDGDGPWDGDELFGTNLSGLNPHGGTSDPLDSSSIPPCPSCGGIPPKAIFTAFWDSSTPALEVFNGSGSISSLGSIASWDWDFGDGRSASGPTISHDYVRPDRYHVTLTVTDSFGGSDSTSQDLTVDAPVLYAPYVHLSRGEKYLPDGVDRFLANASLDWYRASFESSGQITHCMPSIVATRGSISAAKLSGDGRPPYQGNYSKLFHVGPLPPHPCGGDSQSAAYSNDENIGPTTAEPPTRPLATSFRSEGFYLDLGAPGINTAADASQNGSVGRGNQLLDLGVHDSRGTYYEYVAGKYVVYWMFYPYNFYDQRVCAAQACLRITEIHEGDWEHIVIRLDDTDQASRVRYYQHNCDGSESDYAWSTLGASPDDQHASLFNGTHPIVWSALGGHASYSSQGSDNGQTGVHLGWCGSPSVQPLQDVTTSGDTWKTWTSLQNARAMRWYGYTGNWGYGKGQSGQSWFPNLVPFGPAGPSPSRLVAGAVPAVPSEWQ
jgi:PKD domain-containing protein/VPS62-like protein